MNDTIIQINKSNVILNETLILRPDEESFISRRITGGNISITAVFEVDGGHTFEHNYDGAGNLTIRGHCTDQVGSSLELGPFSYGAQSLLVRIAYHAFQGPLICATIQVTLVG